MRVKPCWNMLQYTYIYNYIIYLHLHIHTCTHYISMLTIVYVLNRPWYTVSCLLTTFAWHPRGSSLFHLSGAKSPKSPTKWAPKAEPCRAKVGEADFLHDMDCSDLCWAGFFLGWWFLGVVVVTYRRISLNKSWLHCLIYNPSPERTKDFFHFCSIWMFLGFAQTDKDSQKMMVASRTTVCFSSWQELESYSDNVIGCM